MGHCNDFIQLDYFLTIFILDNRPIRVAVFVVDVFYVLLYPTRLAA